MKIKGVFDSHAHYDDSAFDEDRDQLLFSLQERGIKAICNVSADLASCAACYELTQKYDFICCSAGIHPEFASNLPSDWLERVKVFAEKPKVVAVGEIGLDYHNATSSRQEQITLFERQMQLAQALELPVIVHSRNAMDDTLSVLRNFSSVHGVVHCFSGSAQTALQLVDMGWLIGFTGVVTFKNAKKAIRAAQAVPLECILIETDCPYMSPEPWRGRRCDSSMLESVINKLAELKKASFQQLTDATYKNACNVYRWPISQSKNYCE